MIDDFVGISDLSQGLAFVTLLPTRFLPDRSRKLDTRAGFFSPSLDGGLPLFELFNPSRRSSSAIWALSAAISGRLRRHQRNQFFPRRLAWRFADSIRFSNRKRRRRPEKSSANSNCGRPTWAVT